MQLSSEQMPKVGREALTQLEAAIRLGAAAGAGLRALVIFCTLSCFASTSQAAITRPYAVLVNGNGDCCVWGLSGDRLIGMGTTLRYLNEIGAELRLVAWNHFGDRQYQGDHPLDDSAFLREASEFLNALDPQRPLILIGHSFGGDTLVKLASRLRRRVDVLAVLDPTADWGRRSRVVGLTIPANVQIFFNRWQSNPWSFYNTFPLDGRLVGGKFAHCQAAICDEEEQNICRQANGSPIEEQCANYEVTCRGGNGGTKQKRLIHTDLPLDHFIQSQLVERITQAVNPSRSRHGAGVPK